jgi:hypothetical protein
VIRLLIVLITATVHTVAVVMYLMSGQPGEAGVLVVSNLVTGLAVFGYLRYRNVRLDRR